MYEKLTGIELIFDWTNEINRKLIWIRLNFNSVELKINSSLAHNARS